MSGKASGTDAEGRAPPALEIQDVTKTYSRSVTALKGISLAVREGEVFGLLGPNGAGKTTLVKASLTLTKPTLGRVSIMGVDALKWRSKVRRLLGYVPQEVSVDRDLTGRENLLMFSKLYGVGREEREERMQGALLNLGLADRADDLVKTYSGGMMRRLEIAQALVNRPKILFLDEPSMGLDPMVKHEVWSLIKRMKGELGSTIIITTHDMVEAEQLCDRVAIINDGRVVVSGTPDELKALVGGEVVNLRLTATRGDAGIEEVRLPPELGSTILGWPKPQESAPGTEVSVAVKVRAEEAALRVAKAFEAAGFEVQALSYSRPSLDDVFLKYTRTRISEAEATGRREKETSEA